MPVTTEQEEQADCFARAFLMPEEQFREVCERFYDCYDGRYDIRAIADHFGVPIMHARIRAKELGICR